MPVCARSGARGSGEGQGARSVLQFGVHSFSSETTGRSGFAGVSEDRPWLPSNNKMRDVEMSTRSVAVEGILISLMRLGTLGSFKD